ncbi:MAG: WD40/YVTN/BNR-like repeat-containing protein [Candidatus Aminicenantales bacterium]
MRPHPSFRLISLLAVILCAFSASAFGQAVPADIFKTLNYRSIGPTRESGRFIDFAVPLQQKHTFYAAAATGGLWKTTNNGQTFSPLFAGEKAFSIGDVAVAPSNPDILWVGTGEANNSRTTYYGDGVYKSVDGGRTWKNMGLPESHHIGRIVIHPTNPDIVYVAALGHLYSENPDRGLYKTTDGGLTWTKALDVVEGGRAIGCVDVVMDPMNPDVLVAATYDRLRKFWTYNIGGPGSGIHKTVDGGKTWTKLTNGLPGGLLGRIGLAISSKNPKILYAVIENVNKPKISPEARWKEIQEGKASTGMIDGEVYRSDNAGETWAKVSPEKTSIGGYPGYYYGQIIVDPADEAHVYVLSVGVLESKDGGKTWGPQPPFRFGGDNHALWIDPADSGHMLLGFDHGLGVTWDAGKNWFHPDNLPLGQLVAVGYDNAYPYNVAAGLQDNGSAMGPSTKKGGMPIRMEDWASVGGGDGMTNVFDRKSNRFLYNESQFGSLQRTDLVTGETKDIGYRKEGMRFNWNSPVIVSAHDPKVIYFGGNIVLKSTNRGETWAEISPDLTTNDPAKLPNKTGGDGNIQACTITFMAESILKAGLLWAGTDDGLVWMTKDDGKNWTKVSDKIAGNPGYWVSRVEASASDPATAYVSYSGFRNDDFRPFLYKTTDYGETWTSLSGNLPNATINVVREDPRNPNLLFVGTDGAISASLDGGKSWMSLKGSLPTVPVHDLQIHPRENDLIVATHGRSAWIADISAIEESTPQVLEEDVHLFSIEPGYAWSEILPKQTFSANFSGKSEPAGMTINYYLKTKPQGEVTIQILQGAMKIAELKGPAEAGFNSVIWPMSRDQAAAPAGGRRRQEFNLEDIPEEYRAQFLRMRSGPPVGAGFYKVVLTVDGGTLTRMAEVRPDPGAAK